MNLYVGGPLFTLLLTCLLSIWYYQLWTICTLKVIIVILIIVFVGIPFVWKYSSTMQKSFLFLNFVKYPYNVNFNLPQQVGLKGAYNFYIKTEDGARLGTWHILPERLADEGDKLHISEKEEKFDEWVRNGDPVVLYMHGNSGTRAASHRVDLYKVLQRLNFHVIAVDYRSYADSSSLPFNETTTVIDGMAVFQYFYKKVKNDRLFVWGHSLGTGISSHFVADLEEKGFLTAGLMLEAPFNNMRDEVREFPLTQIFRFLPWFEYTFLDSLVVKFESDKNLLKTTVPVLILHAEDDEIIPLKLGKQLYDAVATRGEKYVVLMKQFPARYHLGHKFIFRATDLPEEVTKFEKICRETFKDRKS